MDDEKIVALFLARDQAALRETAQKYGPRLRSLANSILDDPHAAEECENDTYLQAWNSILPASAGNLRAPEAVVSGETPESTAEPTQSPTQEPEPEPLEPQEWTPDLRAEDYFWPDDFESIAGFGGVWSYWFYLENVFEFTNQRDSLESAGIIPSIGEDSTFLCRASYDEDGQITNLEIVWKSYVPDSEGNQSLHSIDVCYSRSGPGYTAGQRETIRDGITIVGIGKRNEYKQLTFHVGGEDYQISGTDVVTCEELVQVLDFFLENRISLEKFPMEAGEKVRHVTLEDEPDAFAGYYPTDPAYCGEIVNSQLEIIDGQPTQLLCEYQDSPERIVKEWHISAIGAIGIEFWCQNDTNLMLIEDITLEELKESFSPDDDLSDVWVSPEVTESPWCRSLDFTWNGYQVSALLYWDADPEQVWEMLQDLQANAAP